MSSNANNAGRRSTYVPSAGRSTLDCALSVDLQADGTRNHPWVTKTTELKVGDWLGTSFRLPQGGEVMTFGKIVRLTRALVMLQEPFTPTPTRYRRSDGWKVPRGYSIPRIYVLPPARQDALEQEYAQALCAHCRLPFLGNTQRGCIQCEQSICMACAHLPGCGSRRSEIVHG